MFCVVFYVKSHNIEDSNRFVAVVNVVLSDMFDVDVVVAVDSLSEPINRENTNRFSDDVDVVHVVDVVDVVDAIFDAFIDCWLLIKKFQFSQKNIYYLFKLSYLFRGL